MGHRKRQSFPKSEQVFNLTSDTLDKEETQVSNGAMVATNQVFSGELQALDEQIMPLMTKSQNILTYGGKSQRASICTVCGKEGTGKNIKDHIEANHIEGVSIPCNFCEKTFRSRNAQRQHITKDHK